MDSAEQLASRVRTSIKALYDEEMPITRITRAEQMPLFAKQKEFWTIVCEFKNSHTLYRAQMDIRLDNAQITRYIETKRQAIMGGNK